MSLDIRVVFIGAGNMAEAMISGIIKTGTLEPRQVIVTNRSNEERLLELHNRYGVQGIVRDKLKIESADIIVLAMKPKDAKVSLDSIKDQIRPDQVVMSVLAGISTTFMEKNLQAGQQVIRVMPNTSSMIQESATAISPGENVTMKNVRLAKKLLQSIGKVYLIEEEQMDLFTGIAGSGPAYYYYLMEHVEKIAKENGMEVSQAREIGAQTILGAARMMLEREETPAQLRKNITSKNGTTASGLQALADNGGGDAIKAAIEGAMQRSKEISEELEKAPVN
ncbi:pyrroline-5-carboxylate reductase [Salipaludibacillus neizhouensis]|uniref:Pyrroline-5-carboxylate reductase n=1 Tax=Salipaludibacillus neizhouensis TaxID=885475 RepID=A0A3A9K2E4_9BACI|nr:pyrroline-5-carboxylate reductase [Salipaludibacillus neizhouensis]RKL67314.1 pyrroline-5-carboxylate reductase [Salipaludibacillus neizhouensis]